MTSIMHCVFIRRLVVVGALGFSCQLCVCVCVCVLIGGDLPAGSPLGLVGACKNFIPGIWDSLKIVKVYLAVQE